MPSVQACEYQAPKVLGVAARPCSAAGGEGPAASVGQGGQAADAPRGTQDAGTAGLDAEESGHSWELSGSWGKRRDSCGEAEAGASGLWGASRVRPPAQTRPALCGSPQKRVADAPSPRTPAAPRPAPVFGFPGVILGQTRQLSAGDGGLYTRRSRRLAGGSPELFLLRFSSLPGSSAGNQTRLRRRPQPSSLFVSQSRHLAARFRRGLRSPACVPRGRASPRRRGAPPGGHTAPAPHAPQGPALTFLRPGGWG